MWSTQQTWTDPSTLGLITIPTQRQQIQQEQNQTRHNQYSSAVNSLSLVNQIPLQSRRRSDFNPYLQQNLTQDQTQAQSQQKPTSEGDNFLDEQFQVMATSQNSQQFGTTPLDRQSCFYYNQPNEINPHVLYLNAQIQQMRKK
jgi:hypothetical protein